MGGRQGEKEVSAAQKVSASHCSPTRASQPAHIEVASVWCGQLARGREYSFPFPFFTPAWHEQRPSRYIIKQTLSEIRSGPVFFNMQLQRSFIRPVLLHRCSSSCRWSLIHQCDRRIRRVHDWHRSYPGIHGNQNEALRSYEAILR